METEVELKHRHMIAIYASEAARYFAMHAANKSETWRDSGIERLQNIARMLNYDFAPRKPLQETKATVDLEQVLAALAKAEGQS